MKGPITSVEVLLDDNVPASMNGIFRIGKVTSFDEFGNQTTYEELVDNIELHSLEELISYVAHKLNVSSSIISFSENE